MATVKVSALAELTTLASTDFFLVGDQSESVAEKSKYTTLRTIEKTLIPPGMVMAFMGETVPTGWLACDGSAVSRATYAELFTAIADIYGEGDGGTTFNVPDLRGYFLRGRDDGAGVDPDAATRTDRGDGTDGDSVGTVQADEYAQHRHGITAGANAYVGYLRSSPGAGSGILSGYSGGNETRPKNINVNYCIKY